MKHRHKAKKEEKVHRIHKKVQNEIKLKGEFWGDTAKLSNLEAGNYKINVKCCLREERSKTSKFECGKDVSKYYTQEENSNEKIKKLLVEELEIKKETKDILKCVKTPNIP